jgi:hypothetical protein
MKNTSKAATMSANITIAVIALMTIISEIAKPFKDLLTSVPPVSHHWVTKGIISVILFAVLYFVFGKVFEEKKSGEIEGAMSTVIVTIVSGLAILIFYILHYTPPNL